MTERVSAGTSRRGFKAVDPARPKNADLGPSNHCSLASLLEAASAYKIEHTKTSAPRDADVIGVSSSEPHGRDYSVDVRDVIARLAYERNCYNGENGPYYFDAIEKANALGSAFCAYPPPPKCTADYRYRSADGSCNNLQHPTYGMAMTTMPRLRPSAYDDGIWSPRKKSVTGKPLLSPRVISLIVNERISRLSHNATHLFMQFGQFIDHDTVLTPSFDDIGDFECCAEDYSNVTSAGTFKALQSSLDRVPQCFKISVPPNDPVFYNRACMNFVRSIDTSGGPCVAGPRQQYNAKTAFVDGSQLYGSNAKRQKQLRTFSGGRMASQVRHGQTALLTEAPPGTPEASNCVNDTLRSYEGCFLSGDERSNEQSLLISTHTMFMLEHNRIADKLSRLNPHWDDEQLFQESRKVVGAEMQHITYSAFLPVTIGKDLMELYNLHPLAEGFFTGYDEKIDPSIRSEFATASFRFGHSLIRDTYSRLGKQGQDFGAVTFREHFFRPDRTYEDNKQGASAFMRGMVVDDSEKVDRRFSSQMADFCYSNPSALGFDLAALNTQRGRDHAIQPYTQYRNLVGLSKPKSFEDLADTHAPDSIKKLALAYDHVDDIDLYQGGLAEEPLKGAMVGPMFSTIIADQMMQLKYGDRFYYETADPLTGFTLGQLNEIRKITLSKIICANYGMDMGIQRDAFLQKSYSNPIVNCDQLPDIDFLQWKELKQQVVSYTGVPNAKGI